MLVTECGENVLYTYDTVVRIYKSCHFTKRLIYLAAHPPEEHKARPSQQAFLNKCKTRVCTHKRTCWGICREMACQIYNILEARWRRCHCVSLRGPAYLHWVSTLMMCYCLNHMLICFCSRAFLPTRDCKRLEDSASLTLRPIAHFVNYKFTLHYTVPCWYIQWRLILKENKIK